MKQETRLYITILIVMLVIIGVPFASVEYERYLFKQKMHNFLDRFTTQDNRG